MKSIRMWASVVVAVLSCSLWAPAQGDAAKTLKGSVLEEGFGKFRMKDASGASWLLYLSRDKTSYKPDDWRPVVGDQVVVTYVEATSRGNEILQAAIVELVKAGPNTVRITSPVEVVITEVGRTGYNAKIAPSGPIAKFTKQRSTKIEPTGWVPAVGDKVIMTFTVKPPTVFTLPSAARSDMVYALDKVERAGVANGQK